MKINFKLFLIIFIVSISCFLSGAENNSLWEKIEYYLYKPVALFLPHYEQRKIIYEKDTQYFDIRVEKDESGRRHLVFLPRKGSQSVYDPEHPNIIFSNYIKYSLLAFPVLNKSPEKVLFIGLGGGIMPMIVRKMYPDTDIDIVEIDPAIPKIAEQYFGFKPDSKINIFIEDGRVFVNRCKNKYDVVFIDVYNAYNIPFQFTTKEFYEQIKRILSDNGVCTVNIANMGKEKFIEGELKTIANVFPDTLVFECSNKTNYIPLIVDNKDYTKNKIAELIRQYKNKNIPIMLSDELLENCLDKKELLEMTDKSNIIFTDEFAPVNLMN